MKNDSMQMETKLIHAGEPRPLIEGAVTMPLFHSSTYEYFGPEDGPKPRYPRLSNTPNHLCVEAKLAALEGGEAALVTSSGMAAISTALLALVGEGKHVLAQDNLYGGTYNFFEETFPALGRKVSLFDHRDLGALKKQLRPETCVIYVESISNPLMKVPDLAALAKFAKENGLVSVIDNTFPSPINFNPLALGYDVVVHSATKYLNGHTDILGGCIVGKARYVESARKLLVCLGGSMDSNTCFLLNRGMKTLAVRMRWQNDSALKVAAALETHPKVERMLYPGLRSHSDHAAAKEFFRGYGGMFSFEYAGDVDACVRFLRRLTLPAIAPSLGGVETLVTRPVTTSHSYLSKEGLKQMGIRDTLVRVSVGLESPDDFIRDFQNALDGA